MADPRARPGFGELDFDVDAPDASTSGPGSTGFVSTPGSESGFGSTPGFGVGFGEIDLPLVTAEPEVPESSARARAAVERLPGGNDATRIATGDPLAEFARLEEDIPTAAPSDSGIAARDPRVAEMRERYASGDAEGALELAERISSTPPRPLHFEPEQEQSELRLRRDVLASLPPPPVLLTLTARHAIPRVVASPAEIAVLPLDHRAGFLLAHMDGIHTMEEILDICAMPPEEALALIRELEALGVIRIE